MKIGILCEGRHDEKSLVILLRKLLDDDYQLISDNIGGKPGKVQEKVALFKYHECDIFVFVFDLDQNSKKAIFFKKIVADLIEPDRTVFGFPDNEFEEWLLMDHDALKNVLSIPATKALPATHENPKEYLDSLVDLALVSGICDLAKTKADIFEKIAESIDIATLKNRSKSFANFADDLHKKINLNKTLHEN